MSSRPIQVLLRNIEACVCWVPNPHTSDSLQPLVGPLTRELEVLPVKPYRTKVAILNDCATVVLALTNLAKGEPGVALPSIWKTAFETHVLNAPVFSDLPNGNVVVSVDAPTMYALVGWKLAAATVCHLTPHGLPFFSTQIPAVLLRFLEVCSKGESPLFQPTLLKAKTGHMKSGRPAPLEVVKIEKVISKELVPLRLVQAAVANRDAGKIPCTHVASITDMGMVNIDILVRVRTFPPRVAKTGVDADDLSHTAFFFMRRLVDGGPCSTLALAHVPSLRTKPRLLVGAPSVVKTTMHIQALEPALPKSLDMGTGVCPVASVEVKQWAVVTTELPPMCVHGNPHAPAPAFVCRITNGKRESPLWETAFVVAGTREDLVAACPRVDLIVCVVQTLYTGLVSVQLDEDKTITACTHFTAVAGMNEAIRAAWVWAVNTRTASNLPKTMHLHIRLVATDSTAAYINCIFEVQRGATPPSLPPFRQVAISY